MTRQKIFDQNYWRDRLTEAGQEHHAIYLCTPDVWGKIAATHKKILSGLISENDSVIDAGCAWGRLLSLMPENWRGDYLGVDLSPDFIELAKRSNPARSGQFEVGDIRHLSSIARVRYDWAVLISIKQMVLDNAGQGAWSRMETELRTVADRVLILEYDEDDEGEVL